MLCPTCRRPATIGDRECRWCGSTLNAVIPGPRVAEHDRLRSYDSLPVEAPSGLGHETTRVLGAEVHRDPDLAERLIREFLVEPKRCIAWSRGLDNVAVLTDAIASFRRCQVRDALLVLLALVVIIGMPYLAVLWLAVAMVAAWSGVGRDDGLPAAREDRQRTSRIIAVLAGLGVASVLLWWLVLLLLSLSQRTGALSFADVVGLFGASTRGALRAAACIVALLAADALLGVHLLVNVFSRTAFVADFQSGFMSPWRRLGWSRFRGALDRVREAEHIHTNRADVVVFRGDSPFCGSGRAGSTRATVLTLEVEDEDKAASPVPLERLLHESIENHMTALRTSVPLSPHHRLGGLRHREQVLIPAEELVRHRGDPEFAEFLPRGFSRPPERETDVEVARRGVDTPHEWARYYQYFAVESWDREVVVSCYVTLGTDGHYLYLQWTPCLLAPFPRELREALDDYRGQWRRARRRFLPQLVTFPATLPARTRRVFVRFRPLRVPDDGVAPAQFGAWKSVREIAVESIGSQWFQRSDIDRYEKIFDRVMIEAIRVCLAENGLSRAEFNRFAHNVAYNFGDVSNSNVAVGDAANVTASAPPPPA